MVDCGTVPTGQGRLLLTLSLGSVLLQKKPGSEVLLKQSRCELSRKGRAMVFVVFPGFGRDGRHNTRRLLFAYVVVNRMVVRHPRSNSPSQESQEDLQICHRAVEHVEVQGKDEHQYFPCAGALADAERRRDELDEIGHGRHRNALCDVRVELAPRLRENMQRVQVDGGVLLRHRSFKGIHNESHEKVEKDESAKELEDNEECDGGDGIGTPFLHRGIFTPLDDVALHTIVENTVPRLPCDDAEQRGHGDTERREVGMVVHPILIILALSDVEKESDTER
mmetsp:Transcript_29489/g.63699  ORF Transcript_29489/g.63699 Transcript_29489/m.63699 type:complete len:280 (-) Transcript_29489:303-1142(-)